jgi:hypothetical protein
MIFYRRSLDDLDLRRHGGHHRATTTSTTITITITNTIA